MAWQLKTRKDVADVSLLGWIQEKMHSLSDPENVGAKFSTIADGDHMVAFAFWNPDHADMPLLQPPQGSWACEVITDGTLEEVLQAALGRLEELEKRSSQAAFHARIVATPGTDQLGRLALYSPPANKNAETAKVADDVVSDLIAEQRLMRNMFLNMTEKVEELFSEVSTLKASLN